MQNNRLKIFLFAMGVLAMTPTVSFSDVSQNPAVQNQPTQNQAAQNPAANETSNAALQAAAIASQSWLKLIDSGRYGESWDQASALMKLTIHKDEWQQLMDKVRKPLGQMTSRQVLDQRVATNPHGLPKGDYQVMFYKTAFTGKPMAYELVTLFLEDGQWRVMTYQVD